jgi:rapamycin-insensitive companion of mTOR
LNFFVRFGGLLARLNVEFALRLEASLQAAVNEVSRRVQPEPHFFGELAQTTTGCELLRGSNVVTELLQSMRDQDVPADRRRAALWALGHIGKPDAGFALLRAEDPTVTAEVVRMAEDDDNLNLRGVAFFVLGMLASSGAGREELKRSGWTCGGSSAVALPQQFGGSRLFLIPDGGPALFLPSAMPDSDTADLCESEDALEREILVAVAHLSNAISAESASRSLKRLRAQHDAHFSRPSVVVRALKLVGLYSVPLPVRRFVYKLFDTAVIHPDQLHVFDVPEA